MPEKVNVDLNDLNTYVDSVNIRGSERTKTIYIDKTNKYILESYKDLLKSSNFNDIVLKSGELRQKLYELGCFKSIDLLIDSSKGGKKNFRIQYDVVEHSRIGGGIQTSIGNNEGALSGSISLPNLFGKGEKATFEYTYGTRHNTDYRFTYQTPIRMNPHKIFSISAFQAMNEFSWSKFKQTDVGVNLSIVTPFSYEITKNISINGKHQFSYEGVWRNLLGNFDTPFEVREQSGHSLKSSLKYLCTIDRRTNPALSNEGGYLNTAFELAGLGGDVKYFKATGDYQYSKTFFKYIIGQITMSAGGMTPWGDNNDIRINDRFFLGGPLSLRGFSMRGAGPQVEDSAIGNDAYWLFGLHIYTPLPFFHKVEKLSSWLKTHSFLNIGNLFSARHLMLLNENRLEYLTTNTRLSVGTGIIIRFASIARLELNYVLPLWKQPSDKFINGLQFGIGIMFN